MRGRQGCGGGHWESALERHSIGFSLVIGQFPSFLRNSPTMDGISFPNQKALASPLSEVHTGLVIVHVNQERDMH